MVKRILLFICVVVFICSGLVDAQKTENPFLIDNDPFTQIRRKSLSKYNAAIDKTNSTDRQKRSAKLAYEFGYDQGAADRAETGPCSNR